MKKFIFLLLFLVACGLQIDRNEICDNSCKGCNALFTGTLEEFSYHDEGVVVQGMLCDCKDLRNQSKKIELKGRKRTNYEGTGVELWETIDCNAG